MRRAVRISLLCLLFVVWLACLGLACWRWATRPFRLPSRGAAAPRRLPSFVCLTTTPARLREPWIVENVLRLTRLPGHAGVVLSLPYVMKRTGEAYEVPEAIAGRASEDPRLLLLRCEDEGPGTKLLGPLRSDRLPADSVLLVCDDDMVYDGDAFQDLARAVEADVGAVHCFCAKAVRGYIGFGACKRTLLPLLQLQMPESCFTVDDDYFDGALELLGIRKRAVRPSGCLSCCDCCVFDVAQGWRRLGSDRHSLTATEVLGSAKRREKQRACARELRELRRAQA